jgi:hypothetical protein
MIWSRLCGCPSCQSFPIAIVLHCTKLAPINVRFPPIADVEGFPFAGRIQGTAEGVAVSNLTDDDPERSDERMRMLLKKKPAGKPE